jgi:hypothetical protein
MVDLGWWWWLTTLVAAGVALAQPWRSSGHAE